MRHLLALAAAVAVSACGGTGDGDAARSTAAAWLAALYDSDGARACALFTAEALATISSCEVAYSSLGEAMGESLGQAGVTREAIADGSALTVELRGEEATVRIDGSGRSVELARTPDGWRISRGLR